VLDTNIWIASIRWRGRPYRIRKAVEAKVFISDLVIPTCLLNAVPDDPDDNKFIDCAVEGNADYIISRDDDLLRLQRYDSVQIVNDTDFLDSDEQKV
jgi:predicted nucleic acid-binding protein